MHYDIALKAILITIVLSIAQIVLTNMEDLDLALFPDSVRKKIPRDLLEDCTNINYSANEQ